MLPSGDNFTSTLFGVGGAPAVTFKFDTNGTVSRSPGYKRMFDTAVAFTAVTVIASATAADGADNAPVQLPLVRRTATSNTSPGASGDVLDPTLFGAGRVSTDRQPAVGTNVESVSPGAASTDHASDTTKVQ